MRFSPNCQRRLFTAIIAMAGLVLSGCESTSSNEQASTSHHYTTPRPDTLAAFGSMESPTNVALSAYYEEWQGTPYQWGGVNKKGIDCSAFTQIAYRTVFQHALPRTTRQQVKLGDKITLNAAQHGDLVFFKTGAQRFHVGIYVGEKQFMHASSSKGVIISRLDNPYWASKFWQVRRYSTPSLLVQN
ncbi:NlpC/P60 family protein [Enterovibrio norvegicus]